MIHYLENKVGVVDYANAQGMVMFQSPKNCQIVVRFHKLKGKTTTSKFNLEGKTTTPKFNILNLEGKTTTSKLKIQIA